MKIFSYLLCLCLGLCLCAGVPLPAKAQRYDYYKDRSFRTEDYVYDDGVKTVLLYPDRPDNNAVLLPPLIPISQDVPLLLSFDKLDEQPERYAVKIINCNADWSVSQLNAIEYLQDYNEFYIMERDFSFNTKVRYVHYRFHVPRVKVSGNYVLKVYEEGNENNLILSRRFMVYENGVGISSSMGLVTGVEDALRNQQIDFNISYNNYQILNPAEQVKVVLRQNFRWDNAITGLRPTFVRDYEKILQYNYFNLENNFKGGNEYRMFDLRTFQYRSLHVDSMVLRPSKNEVYLQADETRQGKVYFRQLPDMNGLFYLQNLQGRDPATEADYAEVVFTLNSPVEAPGKVYVTGAFTNWRLDEAFRMNYIPDKGIYRLSLLLKQGYYNYAYSLLNRQNKRDDIYFEGSHNQTLNNYEILVYYRPFGARTDYLIGYKAM